MAMEGIGECLGLDFSEAFEHAKKEFVRVFRLYHDKLGGSTRSDTSQQTHQSKTSLTAHLWKKLKGKSSSSPSQSQAPPKWNSTSELNHYLEHDFANMDPDLSGEGKLDLLNWWRNNKRIFPVLCHFAQDVLLVPMSSVSSEATFSMVGRIIEERRSSLTPKMVEAITCLKTGNWQKNDISINQRILRSQMRQPISMSSSQHVCINIVTALFSLPGKPHTEA